MTTLQNIVLMILPLILAITLHEAAHAYMARRYGDRTAEQLGRLTLNPIAHIDPIGTVLVPLLVFVTSSMVGGGFIFGWAKPVPINPRYFRNVRMGLRMTAIAGPLSNLIQMVGWAVLLVIASFLLPHSFQKPLMLMSQYGIQFNAIFFVLNMLPILPLDGGRFVDSFLPPKASATFSKIEPYGFWIVLFLIATGVLNVILMPVLYLLTMPIYSILAVILG